MHHQLPEEQGKFGFDYTYNNILQTSLFSFGVKGSQLKERKITSGRPDTSLPDNSIHTCKYNLFTFLPKNLFIQYSKIANIYFLSLGILQLIPSVSNSEGQPTIWAPLFIINIATAAKDLYEDLKRRKSDMEENNSETTKLMQMGEEKICWREVRVGDIIRIEKNQFFPADALILDTSEPKGLCYIETKNLDGETNLKQKNVQKDIYCIYGGPKKSYHNPQLIMEYEKPNSTLNKFTGRVSFKDKKNISMDSNNFILRGCSLRNTQWVVCLVAYTGHDTKLLMSSFNSRAKQSHLECQMSRQITLIFIFMILICLFSGLFFVITKVKKEDDLNYLSDRYDRQGLDFLISFLGWILILSNLVPISLLVTLEVVKMAQGMVIAFDEGMRHQATKIPTQVQSSNLNEELGQIEYIFSDKTGTLTCNIMEYKKLSVNGRSYGEVKKGQSNYIEDISMFPKVTNVDFRDKQFFDAFLNDNDSQYQYIKKTLFILSLCHTIIIEKQDGQLIYNASSPDELALINFAKFCGVQYLGINEENVMEIKYNNQLFRYLLLHVLEFNSTRKRMSVIIKDLNSSNNKIFLYTKGADSIIIKRLNSIYFGPQAGFSTITNPNHSGQNDRYVKELESTIENLANYGTIGLRTLLLSEKEIDAQVFEQWNTRYLEALASLEKREEKMEALQDEIETDLYLVAATAIEDKLQDEVNYQKFLKNQVGDTIAALIKTGIKVWVLTGDKIETAINIAFSCKLITSDMIQIIIDEKDEQALVRALENANSKLTSEGPVAFIISGDALIHGLKTTVSKKIIDVAEQCSAVLCCRVSPQQKQEVVSLVRREKPTVATLAIGDGANDVNMITAAHVGVGIKGLEGAQAARASDYAIGEFKILRRLLFYHGRECYRRNARLIIFNFYKNTLLVLPQFWFGMISYFSGHTFYDNYTYQLFNVFFAAWPIMIYAVYDQEFNPRDLMLNNQNFYLDGLKCRYFNSFIFWFMLFEAAYQSGMITLISFNSIETNFLTREGYSLELAQTGAMIFGMIVVISNIKVVIISSDYSIANIVFILGSMILYLLTFVLVSNILYQGGQLYCLFISFFSTANVHLGNILILGYTSLLDFAMEWEDRWKADHERKFLYLKLLRQELDREEDDIVFVPAQVNYSHEPPEQRYSIQSHFKKNYSIQKGNNTNTSYLAEITEDEGSQKMESQNNNRSIELVNYSRQQSNVTKKHQDYPVNIRSQQNQYIPSTAIQPQNSYIISDNDRHLYYEESFKPEQMGY